MRLVLFYDLPNQSPEDSKAYNKFHKWIIKKGFLMLQFSVYYKTIPNVQKYDLELAAIKNNCPKKGSIRLLKVTEAQFIRMDIISGNLTINEQYNGKQRYVKIEDNDSEE